MVGDLRLFQVSDIQKRTKLFNCFPIISFLEKKSVHNMSIALYSTDGACFFALHYYLYPAIVDWNQTQTIDNNRKYEYVIYFKHNTKKIYNRKLLKIIQIKGDKAYIYQ